MKRAHTHTKNSVKKHHKRTFKARVAGYKDNNKYNVSGKLRALDDFEVIQ